MTDPIKAKIQELCPDVMQDRGCDCPDCVTEHGIILPPITLAVVLRAIQSGPKWNECWFITTGGDFCRLDDVGAGEKNIPELGDRFWDLKQDNYDQQGEETKAFMGSTSHQ